MNILTHNYVIMILLQQRASATDIYMTVIIQLLSLLSCCLDAWTNFSLQDKPWAKFATLEVAACIILCTYCPV